MRRIPISFRQLLERVLPSHALSAAEQLQLQEDLSRERPEDIEEAALLWLERLAERGHLRRLPEREEDGERVLRFQPSDGVETIAVRFPSERPAPGLVSLPRALVTLRSGASASEVRQILSLDQELVGEERRLPSGYGELIQRAEAAAVELLQCESASFFPAGATGESEVAYAPPPGETSLLEPWARAVVVERDRLLHCPDLAACPPLAALLFERPVRSVAAVAVRSTPAGVTGYLEVRSHEADFFGPERLALLSLLSENFSALLTRAARLEELVFVDPLTGSFNISYFRRALAGEVARAKREAKSMALCIADIDDFKQFNTLYGYDGGNQVLVEIARTLRGGVRPFDSVARWGGEEFAVILTAPVGREEAETVSERLRRAVEERELEIRGLDQKTHRARVTVSVGIALYPSDASSAEGLWRAANRALLVAKKPPKNRIVFFSDVR